MFKHVMYRRPLVTPEYQEQLDNLAETLVTPERAQPIGTAALEGAADFDRVFGEYPEVPPQVADAGWDESGNYHTFVPGNEA